MDIDREYKRDMYNNYMVLGALEDERYEARMLMENDIEGIMKMQIRNINNAEFYYYDISSKQPIANLFERGQLRYDQIKSIVLGIVNAIEEGSRYLLSENDFVLNTEFIYITLSNFSVSLCYYPGYDTDISSQFTQVVEYLMDRTDHTDEKAVMLVYGLYKATKNDFTLSTIKDIINGKESGNEFGKESCNGFVNEISVSSFADDCKFDSEHANEKGNTLVNSSENEGYKNALQNNALHQNVKTKDASITGEKTESDAPMVTTMSNNFDVTDAKYYGGGILAILAVIFAAYKGGLIINQSGDMDVLKLLSIMLISLGTVVFVICKLKERESFKDEDNGNQDRGDNDKKENDREDALNTTNISSGNFDSLTGEYMDYENETVLLADYRKENNNYTLKSKSIGNYDNISIKYFPFVVGKIKDKVDYVLGDDAISRLHAKIYMIDDGQLVLTDLNSKNGTYINGERLMANETRKINIGDEIGFADFVFILQ